MGMKLLPQPWQIDYRRAYFFFDDFEDLTSGKKWTTALTNSSTPTISAVLEDGVLIQANTASTNDASFLYTTNPQFLWANNIAHACEVVLQFTEAATNNANIWFGFSSLNTVAQLVNASAGPARSFSGAGIYKQGGSLTWRTISSQSTTQTLTNTAYTAGQAGYTRLRVECRIVNAVLEVTYWIDQGSGLVQMLNNATPQRPFKDTITLSSPAAMYFGFGVKNGTTTAETLNVDYASAWKLRSNLLAAS